MPNKRTAVDAFHGGQAVHVPCMFRPSSSVLPLPSSSNNPVHIFCNRSKCLDVNFEFRALQRWHILLPITGALVPSSMSVCN